MNLIAMVAALALAGVTSEAQAQEDVDPAVLSQTETLSVSIRSESGPLWSGALTLGPEYGYASVSQSISEFAQPCLTGGRKLSDSLEVVNSFTLGIARSGLQSQSNIYEISLQRTEALSACEGAGSNTSGITRTVNISRGESITIELRNGDRITISRP